MMFPPPKKKPEKSPLRPATIVEVLEAGYRYKVFYGGGYHELLTQPAIDPTSNPQVGDLVITRNVHRSSQLFLPASRQGVARAIIAGYGTNNNYPTVLYTLNITASSPVWIENRNGLPNSYWGQEALSRCVVDADNVNRAWLLLATGSSAFSLYRNDGLTVGESWAKVYDQDNWLSALGYSGGTIAGLLVAFDVCRADTSLVGILAAADITHGGSTYNVTSWIHSHDYGDSYTKVDYSSDYDSWSFEARAVRFGANTTTRLYLGGEGFEQGAGQDYAVWVSDDHGHTITGKDEATTGVVAAWCDVVVPKHANPNDDRAYFITQSDNAVFYTADGADNISQKHDGVGLVLEDDVEITSPINNGDYLITAGDKGNSKSIVYSSDQGVSWTEEHDASNDMFATSAKTQAKMIRVGLNNGGTVSVVYYGFPGSWTNATGNIDTAMSDPPFAWFYTAILE